MPFSYGDTQVRVVTVDGEPWFVLADLCSVLEIAAPGRLAARLDKGVRQAHTLQTAGGAQQMTIVSEAGMYEVVIRSDKPEAMRFRRWITSDVLPAIRKTGTYSVAVPAPAIPTGPELLAHAVLEAQQMLAAKDERIAELEPRAEVADELMDATGLYTIQAAAKALGWGPNVIFRDLRRLGILQSNNLPYQRYIHHFEVKLGVRKHPKTGETIPTTRTYVKPSALPYLRKRLNGVDVPVQLSIDAEAV